MSWLRGPSKNQVNGTAPDTFHMNRNTVSIVIPVWNSEKLLSRCLDSVLAQTYTHLEVVVVDDGSPDNAGAIADDYALRHSNVRVIHKENGGSAEARRSGIAAASGEWISLVDSDDALHDPDAIAFLMAKALDGGLDVAYGTNVRMVDGKPVSQSHFFMEGVLSPEQFRRYVVSPECPCGPWACVSRREIWQDDVWPPATLRLPSEDLYTDILLTNHITRPVGLYNRLVYDYHEVPGSQSMTGAYHTTELWRKFYEGIDARLVAISDPMVARELTCRKINSLCFHMREVDSRDPWVRSLIRLNTAGYPLKTRVCQQLLRSNCARRFFIVANRFVKRLLGINRSTI